MALRSTLGRTPGEHLSAISKPVVIGRVVTATITLVCVLIVYNGWANQRLRDVLLIVVAPVVAVFVAHVFAATLVLHVELGRRPTKREWMITARFETRFLLLAVPPAAILVILDAMGVSLSEAIRAVIGLEALTLGFWAGLAAHYAGMRGRALAFAVLGGLIVSVLVLGLEVLLEPGYAAQGALVAARSDACECSFRVEVPATRASLASSAWTRSRARVILPAADERRTVAR